MTSAEFLSELDAALAARLASLGQAARGEPGPELSVADLLATALRNELEAAEEAALWMTREPDVEVKLALARQCGDEARHYRLIEARLRELGLDPASRPPLQGGFSPMYSFLQALPTTAERLAAGPFAREALAGVRNQAFIELCEARGDRATAALYRDTIQPDEAHHHALGRRLLLRFAESAEDQARARAAALRTLELAGELQEIARLKKGICRAPGC